MKKYFIIVLVFSATLSFGQSDNDIAEKTLNQKLDYFLKLADSLRVMTNTSGVGIAIVYKDSIIYKGGLGYRDVSYKKPVTDNTLFPIGSNTKPITGVVASKLVEKELLDWNMPVKKYYPEFEVADEYVTQNATVKDLFTHMTGVGRYDLLYYHNSSITRDEIVSKLPLFQSKFPLRQQRAYNNFMYLVAGMVEEKVSGKTWGNLVNEEVFIPLKMNNSFTSFQQCLDYKERSKGYKLDGKTEVDYQNIDVIAPAGSISSTPHDMALWVQMLTNRGMAGNKTFLTQNQLNYLTGPQAPFNPNRSVSTAIGWITLPYNGTKYFQKEGAIDGFRSKVTIIENKFGIAIMTNTWSDYISLITDYATNIFVDDNYERDYEWEKLLAYKKPKKDNNQARKAIPLLHNLNEYIGSYEDEIYGIIEITEKNKELYFKFHDFKSNMEHTGFDNFQVKLDLGGKDEVFDFHIHTGIGGEIDQIEFKIESGLPTSIFEKKK
ncbi:serine hydrolase [Aquimarina aquimarini]|uniref:serine hydrolase n=1 Tax=Aquimarina aquimarini TaxID=1191734 RepID=UPI000D559DC1|nr:serine hydrolase [Aquimarina aquimarini]